MKKWSRFLGIAAITSITFAVLSATSVGPAVAQGVFKPLMAFIVNDASNPVPVKDINEPGRTPFSYDQVGDCNTHFCSMDFPEVPAGKRLVILHAGAIVRPASSSTIVDLAQMNTSNPTDPNIGVRNIFPMTRIGQAGASNSYDTYAMNQPVLAYVEPGQHAQFQTANRVEGDIAFAQATISGYFVDVE